MNKTLLSCLVFVTSCVQNPASDGVIPDVIEISRSNFDNIQHLSEEVTSIHEKQGYGFVKQRRIGELVFTVSYQPPLLLALKELKDQQYSTDILNKTIEHYSELAYFQLEISKPTGQSELLKENLLDQAEYDLRVKYYSFQVQNDIQVSQSKSITPCVMSHFERTYDVVPHIRVLTAFELDKIDLNEGVIFEFQDNVFDKGIIKLKFDKLSKITLPNLEV